MEKRDGKEKALKQKHRLLVIDCPFSFRYISLSSGFILRETEENRYIYCATYPFSFRYSCLTSGFIPTEEVIPLFK